MEVGCEAARALAGGEWQFQSRKGSRLKSALKAEIAPDAWASLYSTTRRPFAPPKSGRIAVKVINHYGDEALRVFPIP